ncbi:LppX_LprAFG lipoprotein [Actinocrinis puniceicyclus]|uniref:LppX_LprAFG lipoprotein n=1 Tax=Actinocrinis puniceicyclus TaxID=977794 RepID=A0A8J7WN64_9ACTN|nr:LppX_LprAFG lipoprotein [Actinocrinis puniceicyclus]MBS2965476.1 LppX_LprAFG lipoprotein [Actinocrinis puniceicyclus]
MHKRIGLTAGAAALGLAAIAGCTGSGGSSNTGGSAAGGGGGGGSSAAQLSPAAFIKAALTKASNDKTVRVTGTIDTGAGSGTLSSQEQFDPLAMSMTMHLPSVDMSEILVGNTIYMKMPQFSAMLGGKPWAKIDLSSMGALGSSLQSLLSSAKNIDPAQQLQPLLASGDLHKVGTETVDGVQAVHYAGTVDPATALDGSAAATNLTPAQIAQLKSLMKSSGVTTETIDVWVSSDGLPVRETVSANTSAGATKVDMHLSDWGKPVSISAPPADQVGDISSMMGNLGSSPS